MFGIIVVELGNMVVNFEIISSIEEMLEYPSKTSAYGFLGTEIGDCNPGKVGAGPGEGILKTEEFVLQVMSSYHPISEPFALSTNRPPLAIPEYIKIFSPSI